MEKEGEKWSEKMKMKNKGSPKVKHDPEAVAIEHLNEPLQGCPLLEETAPSFPKHLPEAQEMFLVPINTGASVL